MPTFREEIDRYAGICPWLIFGIDLALGSGLDRPMTYREQMFGPEILEKAFSEAVVQMSPDSAAVPLVSRTEVLYDPRFRRVLRNTILFDATFRRMVVFLLCRGCVGI